MREDGSRKGGRAAILAAAVELLAEEGQDAFSLRAVAARCGMTAPAMYRHFLDREALLAAARAAARHRVARGLLRAARPGDAPIAALRRTGEAYLRIADRQPHLYRALFLSAPDGPRPDPGTAAAMPENGFGVLVERVRAAQAAGLRSREDAVGVALTLWAAVHGLAALHLAGLLGLSRRAWLAEGRRLVARLTDTT